MAVRKDQIQISVEIEAQQGVKTYQKLLDETRRVNNEMRRLKRLGQENSEEFRALEKRASELNQEMNRLGGQGANFAQLITRSKQLNRELKSLVPGTKRFIQVTNELRQVNTRIRDVRDQTKGVSQSLTEVRIAGIKVPPVFQKMAIAGNFLRTALRSIIALEIVGVLVNIFRSTDEVTKKFLELRGVVQQLTGSTGDELDEFTVRVDAIAKTFKQDTEEVLEAANALTKQLTGDFSESLTLIEKGFLSGANGNKEFLDNLKEYPAFFREAGLSGAQFVSVISQGVTEGIFSDKSVDLIKEFNLRIRELPKATQEALNRIGISSKQIRKEIDENGIGGAFLLVQKKLNGLKDDAPEVGQVLADVFGAPGEDAGIQFIKNLDLTDQSLDSLIQTGNEYTQALQDQLIANQELAEAQNEVSKGFDDASNSLSLFITRAKTVLLRVAASVLGFFEQLPATATGVRAALKAVIDNIESLFQRSFLTLQITVKRIQKLNPFGKTSEQLETEIQKLRGQRGQLKEEMQSIAGVYRDNFLDALEDVETRKKAAEALLPSGSSTMRKKGQEDGKEYIKGVQEGQDKEAERIRKAKEERQNDQALLSPLQSLGNNQADSSVQSTGEAVEDTSAQEEIIKNRFLQALITEQEFEDQRFQLQQEAMDRRLQYLREKHGEESAEFVALENKKLTAQQEYEKQREELTRRTEEARRRIQSESLSALSGFINTTIELIKEEQGERAKNSVALKAFAVGKVIVDTQQAIMGIIKNAQSNPANILFPGAGALISGLKIATVLAQSGIAIGKIRKASFYEGGPTGNNVLFRDKAGHDVVGAVHKNEWVGPEWQVNHPVYGPVISWLEAMRQRGYKDGGFTEASTTPTAINVNAATATPVAPPSMNEDLMRQVIDSNRQVVEAINRKNFTVTTGQIRDALDEDYRLDAKSGF